MNLYLFPTVICDETIKQLLLFRTENVSGGLYSALFEFVGRSAFTEETVREYVVRALLRNAPDYWREDVMRSYLERDMETVYELFFRTDWNAVCMAAGLLPFPRKRSGDTPGEQEYKEMVAGMVRADTAGNLSEAVISFLRRYGNEEDAMYRAFRWDSGLSGVPRPDTVSFDDLCGLERQKETVIENTRSFLGGFPANNILLIGGGGTGKSSCVKAALNLFVGAGLKLVELSNNNLAQLPALTERLSRQKQKYIIFIDDLSFESADRNYLSLKAALDGQIEKQPDNVLIYATSNRRHLIRESWSDRDGIEDIHENDTASENLSLSGRFGIRLYFPSLIQSEYLDIIKTLFKTNRMVFTEKAGKEAMAWAAENNGKSGRTAQQFVSNYRSQYAPLLNI